jgi:hypothetical protein
MEWLCRLIYSRAAGYVRMAIVGCHTARAQLCLKPRRWVSLRRGFFRSAICATGGG